MSLEEFTENNSDMEIDVLDDGAGEKRPTTKMSGRGKQKRDSTWKGKTCRVLLKASLTEFGENTSFHGLRYVTNDTYHAFRRFVWLVVVVAMTTILCVDIIRAIVLMYQHPEMSTISVKHPPNITFPAVTLCNINMFRSDALSPSQVELLASIFGVPGIPPDKEVLTFPDDEFFSSTNDSQLRDNLIDASHRIEDMLFSCRWLTVECSHANFTQRLTDQGVCYTFNDPSPDGGEPLVIRHPGSRNGLFLRLNAQQHLYTYGESTAAGFKILLHKQGEYPMIKDFAFSVSPGFETSIVVREEVMNNLKSPYQSNCRDRYMEDFPFKYSAASCQFACKVNYVVQRCACRDYRWPGSEPICSLDKQVNCIYHHEDDFLSRDERCDCPIACETITYGREMSLAYWPASYVSMELQSKLNITEDTIRRYWRLSRSVVRNESHDLGRAGGLSRGGAR